MSRSRRHAPFIGWTTARSEKRDKAAAHRRERRRVHVALASGALATGPRAAAAPDDPAPDAVDIVLPHTRELSNVWDYAKDGRQYLGQRPRPELRRYLRK